MFSLHGKITVITGASSGIGRAAADRFAKAGSNIVIACRRDVSDFAKTIGARWIRTDVGIEREVKACMDQAADLFGRIDVLINNAGYWGCSADLEEASEDEFDRNFQINAKGPFFGIKHASRHMPRGSSIITTTSLASVIGLPGYGAYTAAKFAASGLLKCAAMELGPKGIRVNEISPTSVDTPMLRNQDSAEAEIAMTSTASALGRIVQPEEVAALMHFLASDDCGAISGQQIVVDCGQTAGCSVASMNAWLGASNA
ncbi:SDR family oxidoreductase [Sphingobium sp. TB-6]|uniref:SDR family NAD(P)-dependent oxidoreductase n=1 Tax=Sphingobium sp. TB-6 TaxID=2728850 RepID=UPI00146A9EB4|nr:SDR family oxidoreductase [Sphingobium sp. TB-6]NML90660.1 SDR family oxidoreductase [Sphingobium sp. TB-6]